MIHTAIYKALAGEWAFRVSWAVKVDDILLAPVQGIGTGYVTKGEAEDAARRALIRWFDQLQNLCYSSC